MSNKTSISEEVSKLLKELIEQTQKYQKREKKNQGGLTGLVDKPYYYDNFKIAPSITETVARIRKGFNDGGLTSDISQMEYLVSVLEGATSLTPMEQKILEELRDDLSKVGMGAAK